MRRLGVVVLLVCFMSSSVFADIIINPTESCRAEGDRPDENRRSSTKLVVKPFKKSWIKFDLGGLDVGHLETATLTVAAIDNESDNSCDLSVVNDSYTTGKDWTSDTLTWNNAPANDTLSEIALTTDATLITNFAVDGLAGTPFVIDILVALQADTDGIVQFVLHNSNGQISFAPHDHPEATWRPFIDATVGTGNKAKQPYPAKATTDVSLTPVLSWTPGVSADKHDVYFGADFSDVNSADASDLTGIYRVRYDVNSYTPTEVLDFDTTYYWRVDEVNAAPDYTIFKGNIWSFTVEPFSYAIENITATASSSINDTSGPQKTIDGSGLNDNDQHSTDIEDMWLSNLTGAQPTWIEFEFDRVYKLHEMWVWNQNQVVESSIGYGFKDVTIEHSVDGISYTPLGSGTEFARGSGTAGYAANTTVDLGGIAAKYVKITANSNWGGIIAQYGLSEVRFFYIPVVAREPNPTSGTTDMDVANVTLSWRAGREAASHNVYFSSDEQAVIDETISPVSIPADSSYANYNTGPLVLGQSYYWKVNEVNEAGTPTTWQGDVWNFTTREFLVVDDFEDYNDFEPDRIFDTWIDGWTDPTKGGSQVGYDEAPFTEQTIVHGGQQSMPVNYDNSTVSYSEVTVNVTNLPIGQDWTKYGIKALKLYFYGDPDNGAQQMYVKLNGSKIIYDGEAANLTLTMWQAWNIDLADFGVNLSNVTELSIGLERSGLVGGKGVVYFDDIQLYISQDGQ